MTISLDSFFSAKERSSGDSSDNEGGDGFGPQFISHLGTPPQIEILKVLVSEVKNHFSLLHNSSFGCLN